MRPVLCRIYHLGPDLFGELWKHIVMKILINTLLISLIFSCAGSKKMNQGIDDDHVEIGGSLPEWVATPDAACNTKQLCASAQGSSMAQADSLARKNLAAIFKTQITSEFDVEQYSIGSDPTDTSFVEKTYNDLQEKVNEEIIASKIAKRYQNAGVFFSLAVLDKDSFARSLKQEIDQLDSKMWSIFSQGKRSSHAQLLSMYRVRADLSSKYSFLSGSEIDEVVSIDKINQLKFSQAINSKNFVVSASSDQESEVASYLKSMLTTVGHKVVDRNSSKSFDQIDIKVISKKLYFNVKGFDKYEFEVILSHLTSNKVKVGELSLSQVAVGRDEVQAWSKIASKLRDDIEQKLSDLKID